APASYAGVSCQPKLNASDAPLVIEKLALEICDVRLIEFSRNVADVAPYTVVVDPIVETGDAAVSQVTVPENVFEGVPPKFVRSTEPENRNVMGAADARGVRTPKKATTIRATRTGRFKSSLRYGRRTVELIRRRNSRAVL